MTRTQPQARSIRHCRTPRTLDRLLLALLLLLPLQPALAEDWVYTTRPGDTLWDISRDYLKGVEYWQRLQEYNNIANAKQILPGTRIQAPLAWLKQPPAPAQTVSVVGAVTLRQGVGEAATPLNAEMALPVGSIIETGADASVTLRFADGSLLLIQAHSRVILDSLSAHGESGIVDTRLRLQKGRADTKAIPFKAPGSRYEITTPAAVAAVRGTEFRVNADPDQSLMRSEVLKGQVAVSAVGVTQAVGAGFGTVAEAGKAPLAPRPLLAAPDLLDLPRKVQQIPLRFSWPALDEAQRYRAQLAADAEFQAVLRDKVTAQPEVQWTELPDAEYFLRVRAIDALGLEGRDGFHRFSLETELAAPFATTPPQGSLLPAGSMPSFAWRKVQGASGYRFQLAQGLSFGKPLIDVEVETTSYTPAQPLPAGRYYWRLASRNARGQESAFGPGQPLIVLPGASQP